MELVGWTLIGVGAMEALFTDVYSGLVLLVAGIVLTALAALKSLASRRSLYVQQRRGLS